MPSSVPTPLAAAIGVVPTVLDRVRRLPGRAVQLPILAVSSTLAGLDLARREYDDLARRGERIVARLRGQSLADLESDAGAVVSDAAEAVERVASRTAATTRTATARTAGTVSDLTERAAQRGGQAAEAAAEGPRKAAKKAGTAARTAAGEAASGADTAEQADETPAAEQPKGAPTPAAPQAEATSVDTAASADVVDTVEQVAQRVGTAGVPDHDTLPLPDYDHMTLGSLRGRLRSLTVEELVQVREYEKAHADRLPVVTMLDNRIAKLASDGAGAATSDAPPTAVAAPEKASASRGRSKVTPETAGPKQNPPSQGVPTNPAQPR